MVPMLPATSNSRIEPESDGASGAAVADGLAPAGLATPALATPDVPDTLVSALATTGTTATSPSSAPAARTLPAVRRAIVRTVAPLDPAVPRPRVAYPKNRSTGAFR